MNKTKAIRPVEKAAFAVYDILWRISLPALRRNRRLAVGFENRLLKYPLKEHAHLWIHNKDRTWRNNSPPPASGSVNLPGLIPNSSFEIEWWDTESGSPIQVESMSTNGSGVLTLEINNLATDIAVKISGDSGRPAAPRNVRIADNP